MIRSIDITRLVKNSEEFDSLVELLDLLGLRRGHQGESKESRFVEFFPPRGTISILERKTKRKLPGEADVWIQLFDPDTALELLKKRGFKILEDNNRAGARVWVVELAAGTRVALLGFAPGDLEDIQLAGCEFIHGHLTATGKRFAIVVSRFNSFITERLLLSAVDALTRAGAVRSDINVVRVPGSFEIPSAARTLAETKKYDAIICLGCLLRGETAHYDVIVNEVTRGIGQAAQETGVPHAFGVLTCDTLEQAIDRAGLKMGNKGFEAALAAVEMANLKKAVVGRRSSVVGKPVIDRQPSAVRKTAISHQPSARKNKSKTRTVSSKKRKS
jgi:6,7-dimethyl-8-ribityllumazine synthase